MRVIAALLLLVCLAAPSAAADRYAVKGMVVSVKPEVRQFTASIEDIPGFMKAMTMPFEVRDAAMLEGLAPGTVIEFTLVVDRQDSFAESIRIVTFQNVEQDPFSASRLALLDRIVGANAAATMLDIGAAVPDFALTDQRRQRVTLAALRGKVVAVNFVYTRCALPNFCLRLTNHFNALQKRFAARLGKDLILLTLTFDPVHDTPQVMADYARQWNANPATWHFLTGPEAEVQRVCQLFGVHAFSNEGLMDHSLHTVLIDRRGRLAVNLEGNQFSPGQLGDLTEALLR